jgi:hypothetical protein
MNKDSRYKEYDDNEYFEREWNNALNSIYRFWGSPEDVKVIMNCYCYCVENKKFIPKEILEFFHGSFTSFLLDNAKLESALMLKGKKGRPKLPPPSEYPLAPDYIDRMLTYILDGYSKDKALQVVINDWKSKGKNLAAQTINDHYKIYAGAALSNLISERKNYGIGFTQLEKEQLTKYFNIDCTPK